jgi:putative tryptophan/tyrosine transport system substrate-binding protein
MKRRAFIAALGVAATWPVVAHGQQPAMPVIGFLSSRSPGEAAYVVGPFKHGLKEAGYVEGQNVVIEYRWAEGDYDKLPGLATELAASKVAVIAATGDVSSARAAQGATNKIPIVFTIGADPVKFGLVSSFNRPGGNVTGISLISAATGSKRIQVLHKLAPNALIALFMNSDNPTAEGEQKDAQEAAQALGQKTLVVNVKNSRDFNAAYDTLLRNRAGALFVASDPMLLSQRDELIAFAARNRLLAVYPLREFVTAGGLISYGASVTDMYRQAGVYVGRILRGAHPDDLPVIQPTKLQLIINVKTAETLGVRVPSELLALTDEVIE